jgi:brefeldin A-inhibited guanine nucleotide-exchange protein
MYVHLSSEQLFSLIECLDESFHFSRKFNSDHEQRNILWKAGFKGRDKPNLLKHETQSLACMLRILFKMLNDEARRDYHPRVQERLIKSVLKDNLNKTIGYQIKKFNMTRTCQTSMQYYMQLPSESHRESWDNIMLLLMTKIFKLDAARVSFKKRETYIFSFS